MERVPTRLAIVLLVFGGACATTESAGTGASSRGMGTTGQICGQPFNGTHAIAEGGSRKEILIYSSPVTCEQYYAGEAPRGPLVMIGTRWEAGDADWDSLFFYDAEGSQQGADDSAVQIRLLQAPQSGTGELQLDVRGDGGCGPTAVAGKVKVAICGGAQ
jgi:hypothetical protein